MARTLTSEHRKKRQLRNSEIKHLVLDIGGVFVLENVEVSEKIRKAGIKQEWRKLYLKYQEKLDLGKITFSEIIKEYNKITGENLSVSKFTRNYLFQLDKVPN